MNTSSLKYLEIIFDRENASFKPGELVSGKVSVELTKPIKIRGLRMEVFGESAVSWIVSIERVGEEGKYDDVPTVGREEYISVQHYVLGSDTGRAIELPAAQYSYPFSLQLPNDLPSSFEYELGYVRYTIKAIFDRPWKFNYEAKTAFTVVSVYDLNQKPQAKLSNQEEIHKRFCCFCICPWGKLHAGISIPFAGFVPGQYVPVTVHCNNVSTVDISKIKVRLIQSLQFYASIPKRSTRKIDITVAETKCENPFTTTFQDDVTIPLKIPSLPPSGLEYCGIIDLDYTLRVSVHFSGLHCSVERKFPILIGTVPLYGSFNNSDAPVAPQPSAPLLPDLSPTSMPQPDAMPQPPFYNVESTSSSNYDHWDQSRLPPPSYEASMYAAKSIRHKNDSQYVQGAGTSFAPRYPVYDYGHSTAVPNAPIYDKQ